jgi:hypothetical protein
MPSSSPENAHADLVHSVAERLDEIGLSLRPGERVALDLVAPWSLLQRSRSLVDAINWLVEGPSDAATRIVMRSLADLAITIAWLRVDPATHTKLWSAEAYRRELELLPVLEEHMRSDQQKPPALVDAIEQKKSIVSQARVLACEAGVAGVGRRGPLIPSLKDRARQVGTEATPVIYSLFFGPWSEWGHTGAGSLDVRLDDDTVVVDDGPPKDPTQILALTYALYSYSLAELSRWISLGVEDECDALREELVRSDALVARLRRGYLGSE